MSLRNAYHHFQTIRTHRRYVRQACFAMGLYRQGVLHDLSKFSPVEFRAGRLYYQGDRSPNNKEREVEGVSNAWLHHKGRNRHHFEYWIDYCIGDERIIGGSRIPRIYIAEMIADRIAASKVYLGNAYSDVAAFLYLQAGIGRLWFVHPEVMDQLAYLLGMVAIRGESETFGYIRHTYLMHKKEAWTRPADFDTIIQMARKKAEEDKVAKAAVEEEQKKDSVTA